MASIYELTQSQKELMNLVESGELSESQASDTFEGVQGELNDKINDYLFVRREMSGDLVKIESEIDRLTELKKQKQNQIKSLTNRLKNNLESIDKTKFDTGLFKGHFRKGRTSLKVIDSSKVPDMYVKVSVTEKVDTTELKKAIEAGAIKCDGVELVTGESSLIIN